MLQQLLEFSLRHWELVLAFIVVLILLLTFELHTKLTGVPATTPQQTTLLINHNDALVLDMRDSNSFVAGHIIGAKNISVTQLENKISSFEKYKDKPVILVYSAGQPHHKFARTLKTHGFTDLYHLKGGIAAWQQASLPLVKK